MFRQTLASIVIAAGLAGCAANGGFGNSSGKQEELGPTQLAAFSAKSQYPQSQPSDTLRLAAIVDKDKGTIKIYNFSSEPISDSRVWVNRSFVHHIFGIAPQSKVVLKANELYDSMGNTLAAQKDDVSTVQLQTPQGFYNVEGPAMD